jgi:hypothetical protein
MVKAFIIGAAFDRLCTYDHSRITLAQRMERSSRATTQIVAGNRGQNTCARSQNVTAQDFDVLATAPAPRIVVIQAVLLT